MNSNLYAPPAILLIAMACTLATPTVARCETTIQSANSPGSEVYALGPCRIKIANLFGGQFEVSDSASRRHGSYYFPDTGPEAAPVLRGFGFDCLDAPTTDTAEGLLGIRKDGDRWLQKDRYDNWVPFTSGQHAKVFPMTGSNWSGLGVLVDDTTGDETQRVRTFKFCLVHTAKAICGETPVAVLAEPHSDEFAKSKAILQTIEFVDEGSTPTAGSQQQ